MPHICWGGYFKTFCMWMCLPDFEILTFAIPTWFCPYLPPINIPILTQHQILLKLGAFYHHLLKIANLNWVPSGLWWKPPDCYTKIREKAPRKGRHIILLPCQCEYPPPHLLVTEYAQWPMSWSGRPTFINAPHLGCCRSGRVHQGTRIIIQLSDQIVSMIGQDRSGGHTSTLHEVVHQYPSLLLLRSLEHWYSISILMIK